jgi:hypothetical protein
LVPKSHLHDRMHLRALLLVWAGILVFVFAGRLFTTDITAELQVSGSLIGARPLLTAEDGWTVQGVSPGLTYVPHGIGYPVLLLPAAVAGQVAGLEAGKVTVAALNVLWSLVLMAVWFLLARRWVRQSSRSRIIMLGIAGMLAVYGRMPYDVTAAAAAGLAGVLLMTDDRPLWAGICLGLAILIRLDSIVLLPAFWPGIAGRKKLLRLLYGAVPFLLLAGAANLFRFGSPLLEGHGQDPAMAFSPLSGGITGLLFSPGKGLIWYAPISILALFYNRDMKMWLPFALSLILHGVIHDWTGGTGWGPRFLIPTLPLLLLPLTRRGVGGKVFPVLIALGIVLLVVAAWSNTNAIEQELGPDLFDDPGRQRVIWTLDRSPLVGAFASFGEWPPELFGVHAAAAAGLPPWTGFAAQALAGSGLILAGYMLGRRRPEPKGENGAA